MTPDDQILAAELALGLLDEADLAAARIRVADDADLAAEVAWWRDRLAALHVYYASARPDAALEARIAALLGERAGAAESVVAIPTRRRRWPWFAGGAAAGALAASLAAVALIPPPPAPTPPPVSRAVLAAAVVPASGQTFAAIPIVFRQEAGALRVAAPSNVPDRHVAQLWRIGSDGVPHALGLLRANGTTELRITVALAPGDTLAISIERPGGSRRSTPTGPVVAKGTLVAA